MSTNPPSTVPQSGISKSAAKKRAKKAARQQASSVYPDQISDIHLSYGEEDHQSSPIDPSLYPYPGQLPPVEFDFDPNAYYEDTDLPLPPVNGTNPFPLPFPFDYGNSNNNNGNNNVHNHPNGNGNNGPIPGHPPSFNITHEDLIHTANELYRRMADPEFGNDDAYWSSLPAHLRQFIRDAVPFTNPPPSAPNGLNNSQRALYAMAQQIVSAASQGMGLGQGVGPALMANVNGRQYSQPGLGEELGFRRHPDAKEEEYDDEEEFDIEEEQDYAAPNGGDLPKKKNKKKKKKTGTVEPPPAALPPPVVKQPPRQPVPPQPPIQPSLNPPPPPLAPVPTHPPPSSRAAGKQPMSHPPAPASNPPARSARAAGKAPVSSAPPNNNNHSHNHHPAPAKSNAKGKAAATAPPAKIWAQSSQEERENIRDFWLSLDENERRDLLQVEKDAVVRKMKDQHRHSCACAVCGRKKVNIEMELDQLYENYYDELETYALRQRSAAANGIPYPLGPGPFPGSVELDANGQLTKMDHLAPNPPPLPQDPKAEESDEYEEEDYDDDEEDVDEDDIGSDEADVGDGDDLDEPQQPIQQPVRQTRAKPPSKPVPPKAEGAEDFLSFGSSFATIKGGILTVADDLLKNDGSKFLEMMEQLAVRRVVREEENVRSIEEETDDEEEDDDVSVNTRMEEGRRMFQIFAARMFEQRVLQSYREKVAKQREEQLLRELEEEEDTKRAREEKKAKEAQKKKDKKRLQKQQKDEEKAARDAAIAAEQQAAKARAEEAERDRQRKQEEERIRREATKKAAQEEAIRLATERRKRQQEEKEREEEAARKKREREEKARKEREAREKEAKEKERREKEEKERLVKEKLEKERLVKEAKDKAEKERLAKLEEERLEKARKDEIARKEKEAVEQAKILAAQQAARERAKAEKQAALVAAAEKAAAEKAAKEKLRLEARPIAPSPIKKPSNGQSQSITPPMSAPSPAVRGPGQSPAPGGPSSSRTQKPQQFFPPPSMPPIASYQNRIPIPQTFAPGFRPGYPSQSPVFSPPQTNGPGPSSISPNPPPRSFPEPSPPFEHGIRTAPIGMGFPPKSSTSSSNRLPLVEENFPPASAPIGLPNRVGSVGEVNGMLSDDFRRLPLDPSPIAPPNPGPIGSIGSGSLNLNTLNLGSLGAIGRPQTYLEPPTASSSLLNSLRSNSPAPPEQVFGSAALGGDDEIVQPQRRVMSNGWEVPAVAAPGAGRWSSASSIWGGSSATTTSETSSWGAPGINNNSNNSNNSLPLGVGERVPSQQGRQASFAGLPIGQHGLLGHVNGFPGAPGVPGAAPINSAPGGQSGYPQNLFSPPVHGHPSLH